MGGETELDILATPTHLTLDSKLDVWLKFEHRIHTWACRSHLNIQFQFKRLLRIEHGIQSHSKVLIDDVNIYFTTAIQKLYLRNTCLLQTDAYHIYETVAIHLAPTIVLL